MLTFIAGAFGALAGLVSHDLAAQSLADSELRPLAGTCPRCGTRRGWRNWRCPECGRRIGREIVFVAAGAAGGAAFGHTVGGEWALLAYMAFLTLSLALAITDLDAMRIVNRLNIRGTITIGVVLGLTAFADGNVEDLWRALAGAAIYFGLTNLMFLAARGRAFGYGDVKLSVQLGLFAAYRSWETLVWSIFLMAMIGGVVSLVVVLAGLTSDRSEKQSAEDPSVGRLRDAMRRELPYGPAMIGGAWLAIYLVGIGFLAS